MSCLNSRTNGSVCVIMASFTAKDPQPVKEPVYCKKKCKKICFYDRIHRVLNLCLRAFPHFFQMFTF